MKSAGTSSRSAKRPPLALPGAASVLHVVLHVVLHASAGHNSKPSRVSAVRAQRKACPTNSQRVICGRAGSM